MAKLERVKMERMFFNAFTCLEESTKKTIENTNRAINAIEGIKIVQEDI